jgi:hypothetical protein
MWKFARFRPIMYFASPVFGPGDRVEEPPDGGGLPAELVGKSPAEVARYYAEREQRIRAELTREPARTTPPAPPAPPTNAEFWNDPARSVDQRITATAMTKAEFESVAASIRPSMIWAAKQQCRQAHPDFDRVENEVMATLNKVPEYQRTDPTMWETAYIYAKGAAYERLSTEDRVRPPSSEPVNAAGSTPPAPLADLTRVSLPGLDARQTAAHVSDRLGISHDSYRKAKTELDGDGKLPLTMDNRRNR